jgi:2-aminoadipate transaminase
MFVWVELSPEADALALLPNAVEEGVAYVPGAPFFADEGRRNSLRLSFVTLSPNQISEALRRLRAALTSEDSPV